ncbi:glycosyltransferase family 2 protein [Sulfurimonas sp. SWIR-19]|uniref:glycosyltransferase family 2 protein n=1 Tax=Sulfurimonas sp. SWIR-19 TaxID=2878390 RepID=UPI001CF0D90C|nr:glycosyltransferase family 2 protein [Sulfurimonas sp. SWIR-19]UCN01131.1 glycosyltransferase family 2 protein [Sulfurimonas sp. SWIR-19]
MLITVFTPTYNRKNKLHRVYDSLKNQTLKTIDNKCIFEWIIVDDGSTDNTKELIEEWKKEVQFPIYYFYQDNQGKPLASRKGIEEARGELFLFADSDDEFLPETFETFYAIWQRFSDEEKKKCGGIGALCEDQFGKRIGCDYPVTDQLIPSLKTIFGWRDIGLGETWAALKTKNLKKAFKIPDEAKHLKFIPESFFWTRIVLEIQSYSFFINKVLRIYYKNESDNISDNIRFQYPEGFLFESKWFITKYPWIVFQSPKNYIKHMIKYIIYSAVMKKSVWQMYKNLPNSLSKFFFCLLYIPSLCYKKRYLGGKV